MSQTDSYKAKGSFSTTQVSNREHVCSKKGPFYYISSTNAYSFSLGEGGWVTRVFYQEVESDKSVCCRYVSCQYEDSNPRGPHFVASLQTIVTCNLLYWLQKVARHDMSCSLKSPILRILLALTKINLPEHFKILQIVKQINFFSVGDSFISHHLCFEDSSKRCRLLDGDITNELSKIRQKCDKIKSHAVRIPYVSVQFGEKLLIPSHTKAELPLSVQYPYSNYSSDTITFVSEMYPPDINVSDLVPLYKYLKKSKTFKCCETEFSFRAES